MKCQICEENEAAWTLIPTGEGLPQSLCDSCLAIRGLVWSKENIPAEDIAAMLGPLFVRPPTPDEVADAHPPAKPRARKSKAQATPAQGEAPRTAEESAAAANE